MRHNEIKVSLGPVQNLVQVLLGEVEVAGAEVEASPRLAAAQQAHSQFAILESVVAVVYNVTIVAMVKGC